LSFSSVFATVELVTPKTIGVGIGLLAVITSLDAATGHELGVGPFLLPASFTGWFGGRRAILLAAVVVVTVWIFLDLAYGQGSGIYGRAFGLFFAASAAGLMVNWARAYWPNGRADAAEAAERTTADAALMRDIAGAQAQMRRIERDGSTRRDGKPD
jgi:hypothetical protein